MNKIVNKLLLAGENFISEMHLRQLRFTYRACRPFTKNKQIIQNFKNRGNSKFIYQNELDEACFQHDLTQGDFKNLPGTTATDKVLRDKAFNIAKNFRYDGCQRDLGSMIYRNF